MRRRANPSTRRAASRLLGDRNAQRAADHLLRSPEQQLAAQHVADAVADACCASDGSTPAGQTGAADVDAAEAKLAQALADLDEHGAW